MGLFSKKTYSRSKRHRVNTIIGPETVFEGVLQATHSVCIAGSIKGRLECAGQVILSKSGILEADVVAEYVHINGKVMGNITALKQLAIDATGVVQGDVKTASVTVAMGGVLDGTCKMLSESEAMECRPSVTSIVEQHAIDTMGIAKGARKSRGRKNASRQNGNGRSQADDEQDSRPTFETELALTISSATSG